MQIIEKDNKKVIVLEESEEIIVSTNNKETGYISIYNDGKNMCVHELIEEKYNKFNNKMSDKEKE